MARSPITTPSQAGQLTVDSTVSKDLPGVENKTDKNLKIFFSASGSWKLISPPQTNPDLKIFNNLVGPEGYQLGDSAYKRFTFRHPGLPAAALCVEIKDPSGKVVKVAHLTPPSIELPPGYTAEFVINDDPRYYGNNDGKMNVSYASTELKSPSGL